jgi:hypothetical protein
MLMLSGWRFRHYFHARRCRRVIFRYLIFRRITPIQVLQPRRFRFEDIFVEHCFRRGQPTAFFGRASFRQISPVLHSQPHFASQPYATPLFSHFFAFDAAFYADIVFIFSFHCAFFAITSRLLRYIYFFDFLRFSAAFDAADYAFAAGLAADAAVDAAISFAMPIMSVTPCRFTPLH